MVQHKHLPASLSSQLLRMAEQAPPLWHSDGATASVGALASAEVPVSPAAPASDEPLLSDKQPLAAAADESANNNAKPRNGRAALDIGRS